MMKKRKLLIYVYSVVALALLVSCKTVIFDGGIDPLPTTPPTKGPTASAESVIPEKEPEVEKQEPVVTPEKEPTQNPAEPTPTAVPEQAPTPTQAPVVLTPTPVPTQGPISADAAKKLLLDEIGAGYAAEQTGSVRIAGTEYYLFTVSDREHVYTPQIAVDATSKELFYFYSEDELAEFANFPPDNVESAGGEEDAGDDGFQADDAVELLKSLSAMDLGLPAELSAYTILVDEWTTMVYGMECFCVNAYAELENRKQLMGVYFVAIDGSAAYRSDMGDFVLIY